MALFRSLAAIASFAVTSGTKIVLTKSDQEVPGNISVFTVDLSSGISHKVATKQDDGTCLSGATVCGGVYYAVITRFSSMTTGIISASLTDPSATIKILPTSSLWHKVTCDPTSPNSLVGVASDSAMVSDGATRSLKAASGASFHLKRYNVTAQSESYVATFPAKDINWAGQDGIFSFKADGSEVWASWPADGCPDCSGSKKGGHLHVMDTSDGSIKTSVKIEGGGLFSKANPYFLVPDAMRGVFDPGSAATGIFWADLTLEGNALSWKKSQPAKDLWSSSEPEENCKGNLLVPVRASGVIGASTISVVNPKDGSHVADFDTSKIKTDGKQVFAALACNEDALAALDVVV